MRVWAAAGLVAAGIALSFAAGGSFLLQATAGLLAVLGLVLLVPWHRIIAPLPSLGTFPRLGPSERWCAACGQASRAGPCRQCGEADPAQVRQREVDERRRRRRAVRQERRDERARKAQARRDARKEGAGRQPKRGDRAGDRGDHGPRMGGTKGP